MYDHNHYANPHMMGSSHHTSRVNSMSNMPPLPPAPSMMSNTHPPPPQLPGSAQMVEGFDRGEGRTYELVVYQQPIRARMCGFGDKDRRPITPPPCARLVVRDAATGKEIDINEIDTSFFVLTVDLWSADALREVNLVRHSATSPSISSAVSSSYPPPPPTPPPSHPHQYQTHPQHMYGNSQQYQSQPYPSYNGIHAPPPPPPSQQGYYQQPPPPPPPASYGGSYLPAPLSNQGAMVAAQTAPPSGMFTRNLIGSLSASAFKLTDPDNKIGVWFILQDLSVRTEGTFRLKMNFVNVGQNGSINTSNTPVPVSASVFSLPFQVYSAKKFPGVIESTELSKCFATQGIKIPIRKDGPKALSRGQEDDEEF